MVIGVMICYKDRPTELAILLQSLRNQTIKDFKVYILDDFSGSTPFNYHFLNCLFNRMNNEGNFISYTRNEFNYGVSKSRQKIAEIALKDNCEYLLRVDDDVILQPDYIERLLKVLNLGYDLASGVTPYLGQNSMKRESKFILPIANKVILDMDGNFIFNGDDCGMEYYHDNIIPLHHFRSCALYKSQIHKLVNYDSRLTKHGFREEEIFSFKCIINGFKLGMDTKAVAWHLLTPSGGERFNDSQELVKINEQVLKDFVKDMYKQHGNFIKNYNEKLGIKIKEPTKEALLKQNNLIL